MSAMMINPREDTGSILPCSAAGQIAFVIQNAPSINMIDGAFRSSLFSNALAAVLVEGNTPPKDGDFVHPPQACVPALFRPGGDPR